MSLSLLNHKKKIQYSTHPFPHIIIKDALDQDIADKLTNEFPISLFNFQGNNQRIDLSAKFVRDSNDISKIWKDFIAYHASEAFYKEVISAFSSFFSEYNYKYYDNFSTGIRGCDTHRQHNILLDAQISINTPVYEASSVRDAHVDNTNKLFSGLFYLRQKDDHSSGGNLELCKWKEDYSMKDKIKYYKEGIHPKHYDVCKTVEYSNNIAIMFLNSIDAIHRVTQRENNDHPRCFVNLVGELQNDLFIKQSKFKKLISETNQLIRSNLKALIPFLKQR